MFFSSVAYGLKIGKNSYYLTINALKAFFRINQVKRLSIFIASEYVLM